MLDFANETLDQIPFTIQPFVVLPQDFGPLMWRNDGANATIRDQMLKIKKYCDWVMS